jgi:putative membrane protein
VTTLVLCVDRADDIGRTVGVSMPVDGWDAVRSLVTEVGLADPEDSTVNCLLEALRVTRDLRTDDEAAVVAVVSGAGDSAVNADRAVAAQIDDLLDRYDPDSAIVVTDSADDERLVPIVESRLPVDSVDRVVVRQARDIESTYYLLKQFLADEELRSTVLVPLGVGLLLLPVLLVRFSLPVALAGLASLLGAAVLYKGLAVDVYLSRLPDRTRDALYSGQVSVVTYAVAGGLALVGLFLGALAVSPVEDGVGVVPVTQFFYSSIPWLALAALTASTGRLLDELIDADRIPRPYLNLPFGVVALGLVVRGFAGYFLERENVLAHLRLFGVTVSPTQRLALFVVSAIVVSLVGVRVAARVAHEETGESVERS